MTAGFAVLITGILTRLDGLALVGIWLIYIGFGFLAAGFISPVPAHRSARRDGSVTGRRIWSWTIGTSLVLLSNLPAAGACVWAAIEVATSYTVEIRNDSGRTVDAATVSGAGCRIDFGRIPSRSRSWKYFWVEQDGGLVATIRQGPDTRSIPVSGYVSSMVGGSCVVRIKPGLQLDVMPRR
jgi:hypothetical protein